MYFWKIIYEQYTLQVKAAKAASALQQAIKQLHIAAKTFGTIKFARGSKVKRVTCADCGRSFDEDNEAQHKASFKHQKLWEWKKNAK